MSRERHAAFVGSCSRLTRCNCVAKCLRRKDQMLVDFGTCLAIFWASLAAQVVLNRVPRALLVVMDWTTAKNKPSGPISDRCWTKMCCFYIMFRLFVGRFGTVLVGFSDCWMVAGGPLQWGKNRYASIGRNVRIDHICAASQW